MLMWSCTECTPFSDERKVICFIVNKISIINTGLYKDLCVVINGVFSKNILILNNNPIILMTLLNKFCICSLHSLLNPAVKVFLNIRSEMVLVLLKAIER